MSYIALYRKWRPLSFDEMVGQESIIRTLLNQISSGRIAHAYLFTGTRGTGKTTTAKIFSRAVNCLTDGSIPCNVCSNCKSILDESNMDVMEIDAASNNGVDDIRELRENVKYPPSNGKYKVYIIDEVHMLSKGAFNALLKTLEEPPAHVIFILATTEPHKIPATIHSRCQRFDFKRIPYKQVEDLLCDICEKEGRSVDNEAIRLIVQCSDGALRDALSILDRCLSFEEAHLTHEKTLEILGYSGERFICVLINLLIDKNIDQVLKTLGSAVDEGRDLHQLTRELVEFVRKMLLVFVSDQSDTVLDVSKEMQDELLLMSKKIGLNKLMDWLTQLSRLESEARWSQHPRALIELSLIRLMKVSEVVSIEELLSRVEALELSKITTYPSLSSSPSKASTIAKTTQSGNRGLVSEKEKKVEAIATSVESQINTMGSTVSSISEILEKWPLILAALKKVRVSTYALIMEGTLLALEGTVLKIGFDERFEFHRITLEKEDNRSIVEQVIEQQTGAKVRLNCVIKDSSFTKAEPTTNEDWVDGVKDFFKGYEDKISIDPTKEEA